jgi:hypothetical protein
VVTLFLIGVHVGAVAGVRAVSVQLVRSRHLSRTALAHLQRRYLPWLPPICFHTSHSS